MQNYSVFNIWYEWTSITAWTSAPRYPDFLQLQLLSVLKYICLLLSYLIRLGWNKEQNGIFVHVSL